MHVAAHSEPDTRSSPSHTSAVRYARRRIYLVPPAVSACMWWRRGRILITGRRCRSSLASHAPCLSSPSGTGGLSKLMRSVSAAITLVRHDAASLFSLRSDAEIVYERFGTALAAADLTTLQKLTTPAYFEQMQQFLAARPQHEQHTWQLLEHRASIESLHITECATAAQLVCRIDAKVIWRILSHSGGGRVEKTIGSMHSPHELAGQYWLLERPLLLHSSASSEPEMAAQWRLKVRLPPPSEASQAPSEVLTARIGASPPLARLLLRELIGGVQHQMRLWMRGSVGSTTMQHSQGAAATSTSNVGDTTRVAKSRRPRSLIWHCTRQLVLEIAKRRCAYCGAEGASTVDHVMPRSEGGEDDASNLVACCAECNTRKGNKMLGALDTPFTTTMKPSFAPQSAYGSRSHRVLSASDCESLQQSRERLAPNCP